MVRIDDAVITVDDIEAVIGELAPEPRNRYLATEKKRELLDSLVRQELLAKAARLRGYDQARVVQQAFKKALVAELLRRDVESTPPQITRTAIEQYYRDHSGEFVRAEVIHLQTIFVRDLSKAERLASRAKSLAPNQDAFRRLVEAHSEDEYSKKHGGRLPGLRKDAFSSYTPLLEAASSLRLAGDVAGPIRATGGFHVVRLLERVPSAIAPLEDVRDEIMRRLADDAKRKRADQIILQTKSMLGVHVDYEKLSLVTVQSAQPARSPVIAPPK